MKIFQYFLAAIAPAIVGLIQFTFWPYFSPFVWFLFFPTVFFTARYAGFWGGILSSVVSALIVWYVFIPTQLSWNAENPYNLFSVVIFLIMGYFFADSQERLRRSSADLTVSLDKSTKQATEITGLYEQNLALDDIKFAQLANSLPQIVWATTPEGKNIFFNQEWYDYTGLTFEESAGDGWNEPFHPDDQKLAWAAWQNAVLNNGEYSLECRLRRFDGVYRWWLIRGIPAFDVNHKIDKWFGTCTDINDIKASQEAERVSGAKLAAAIDSIQEAILITDKKGNLISFNDAFARLYGFSSKNECPTLTQDYELLFDMYSSDGKLTTSNNLPVSKALKGESGTDLELTLINKDLGETFIGSYTYAPILNQDGLVEGAVVTIRDITEKRTNEKQLQSYLERLKRTMEDTLLVLSKTVDMRDPYTSGHQQRVGKIAEAIGRKLSLNEEQAHNLNLIGLIHDLGKIGVPAEILSNPRRLSNLEMELVKTHVNIGYEILKGMNFIVPVAEIVREHHERMDGSGYPQGLKGDQILFEARIIAVADVIEAMSTHRPYRAALGIDKALEEIELGRGTKYDPKVVDACLELFRKDGYRIPEEVLITGGA